MKPQGEFARIAEGDGRAALVTVVAGPQLGGKLLVRPDGSTTGGLGDAALDREAIAAAGKADVPGVGVGDAEMQQARLAVAQDLGGDLDDGALDAAASHRAGHLSALADGHLRPRRARRRSAHSDHRRDRDSVPPLGPPAHVLDYILHVLSSFPPESRFNASASSSSDASELPAMNSSTNGSAACIPLVRGE